MSRCYLDTNFLYAHLRQESRGGDPRFQAWRARVIRELDGDPGSISALVLDELVYRSVLAWLRDEGDADPLSRFRGAAGAVMGAMQGRLARLWSAVDALGLELVPTDQLVVEQARSLMEQPGFPPRDAFHAAHALAARCDWIVSADADFDRLSTPIRLGPQGVG